MAGIPRSDETREQQGDRWRAARNWHKNREGRLHRPSLYQKAVLQRYREMSEESGVPAEWKQDSGVIHGLLEENNPEYGKLGNKPMKFSEQGRMAREAEELIGAWSYNLPIRRNEKADARKVGVCFYFIAVLQNSWVSL